MTSPWVQIPPTLGWLGGVGQEIPLPFIKKKKKITVLQSTNNILQNEMTFKKNNILYEYYLQKHSQRGIWDSNVDPVSWKRPLSLNILSNSEYF